jgi:hypothetical protein
VARPYRQSLVDEYSFTFASRHSAVAPTGWLRPPRIPQPLGTFLCRLRTGGWRHCEVDPCPLCGEALTRDVGGITGVDHFFSCTSLDPPRLKGTSTHPDNVDAQRIDVECYVGRYRYDSSNAYHHSESLAALAADLHRNHSNDVATAVRPTETHHRLKRLVQQHVEHLKEINKEEEEEDILRELERDVSGTFAGHRPKALFRRLAVSSASPAPPFLSPQDTERLISSNEETIAEGPRLGVDAQSLLMAYHGVPGTPAAPHV